MVSARVPRRHGGVTAQPSREDDVIQGHDEEQKVEGDQDDLQQTQTQIKTNRRFWGNTNQQTKGEKIISIILEVAVCDYPKICFVCF